MVRSIILFILLFTMIEADDIVHKDRGLSDETMRLIYQVFIYSEDLENGYIVAKKAIVKYPESIYWHQKLAEVAKWLDKREEAIDNYLFVFKKSHDKVLGEKILNYAIGAYQYETAIPILREKVLDNPTKENIKDLILIHDRAGIPEDTAEILMELSRRTNADPYWIEKAMEIYIELGDSEAVDKIIKDIEDRVTIDIETTQKISSYYISQKELKKSYDILFHADRSDSDQNIIPYYQQVSDLGWYLQDEKGASKASKELYLIGEARLVDYERIIYYYKESEPELVADVALDGYRKFKKEYLYITYLNRLFSNREYEKLSLAFDRLEQGSEDKDIVSTLYFWLMKGQMYSALGDQDRAEESFQKALSIDKNSSSTIVTLLWFYITNHDSKSLKKMLFKIEESEDIDQKLWLPLAVSNFSLQKPDRAMIYIKSLMRLEKSEINLDIKFIYAYLMQAREEQGAFMKIMREIYYSLEKRKMEDPRLLYDPKFLEKYLKSGAYFIAVDEYEELLKRSKSILDKESYIELSISWSLRHNAHSRARYLASKLSNIEPWMNLSIAMSSGDRSSQLDILYHYYTILPIRDRVVAAINTGNISLAQSLVFRGREDNRADYLIYQQERDLIESNVNTIDIKLGETIRNNLDRSYIHIDNRYYLAEAWSILTKIDLSTNRNKNRESLLTIPNSDNAIDLGLRKKFMRGYWELHIGMRSSIENYYHLYALIHYKLMSRLTLDASYKNSTNANETTYLLIGGKKDEIKTKATLQYLPSSSISLSMTYNKFYSQDDSYLGYGYNVRAEWYHQIHNGYPDMAIGVFSEYGNYIEEFGSNGIIRDIMPNDGRVLPVLPEEFYNIGMSLFYGMVNKEHYTRVWRPYAQFAPYYSGHTNSINLSLGVGYGGSLYGKDHLAIGVSYDQSVNGTQESTLGIYIKYRILY